MCKNILILCVKYNKFIYNVDSWTPVASISWIVSIIIKFMQWNIYTKQNKIQFDHNTKYTTSITKPRGKKKKNTNHHKTTNKGSKPINPIKIKIKTTILVITHTKKSINRIKEQKRKKNFIFHTQTTIEAYGVKKIRAQHHQLLGQWVVESLNRRLRMQLIGEVKRRGKPHRRWRGKRWKNPWKMKSWGR